MVHAACPRALILCGGRGERLGDVTLERPKPMVEIGGRPILWHIMNHFAQHGTEDFLLATGYLGWMVEHFFGDPSNLPLDWRVQCCSTGWYTQNGGRIKLLELELPATFFMAWCDGLSDLDLTAMLAFHKAHGKLCTVAAVQPPERFGSMLIQDDVFSNPSGFMGNQVVEFREKERSAQWINGGFFVCEREVLRYIADEQTQWEREPMARLAKDGQLMAFKHRGFWQCMDTNKDRALLESLWVRGQAPWITKASSVGS